MGMGRTPSRLPYSTDSYFHPLVFLFVISWQMSKLQIWKNTNTNTIFLGTIPKCFSFLYNEAVPCDNKKWYSSSVRTWKRVGHILGKLKFLLLVEKPWERQKILCWLLINHLVPFWSSFAMWTNSSLIASSFLLNVQLVISDSSHLINLNNITPDWGGWASHFDFKC